MDGIEEAHCPTCGAESYFASDDIPIEIMCAPCGKAYYPRDNLTSAATGGAGGGSGDGNGDAGNGSKVGPRALQWRGQAGHVNLIPGQGEITGWEVMQEIEPGVWECTLDLPGGAFFFTFYVDGERTTSPDYPEENVLGARYNRVEFSNADGSPVPVTAPGGKVVAFETRTYGPSQYKFDGGSSACTAIAAEAARVLLNVPGDLLGETDREVLEQIVLVGSEQKELIFATLGAMGGINQLTFDEVIGSPIALYNTALEPVAMDGQLVDNCFDGMVSTNPLVARDSVGSVNLAFIIDSMAARIADDGRSLACVVTKQGETVVMLGLVAETGVTWGVFDSHTRVWQDGDSSALYTFADAEGLKLYMDVVFPVMPDIPMYNMFNAFVVALIDATAAADNGGDGDNGDEAGAADDG